MIITDAQGIERVVNEAVRYHGWVIEYHLSLHRDGESSMKNYHWFTLLEVVGVFQNGFMSFRHNNETIPSFFHPSQVWFNQEGPSLIEMKVCNEKNGLMSSDDVEDLLDRQHFGDLNR